MNAIGELGAISKSDGIPIRRYNELYDWLLEHRFYLLSEDCERVNIAIQNIEKQFDKSGRTVWAVRHTSSRIRRFITSRKTSQAEETTHILLHDKLE